MTPSESLQARVDALARSYLLRGLPTEVIASLAPEIEQRRFPAGTVILRQDGPRSEWLYLIDSGVAHVELTEGNDATAPQLVEVCGEGEVFGAGSALEPASDARARFTVRAVEDLECYLLPRRRAAWLVDRFPPVADALAQRNHRLLRRARAEIARRPTGVASAPDFSLQALVEPVGGRVRRGPVVCSPAATIAEAARRMTEAGVGSLPIVDDHGWPLGIITDSDLRRTVVAAGRSVDEPVSAIMSQPVVTLRPADAAFEALRQLSDHGIDHLVLVDEEGRVSGVISSGDLLLAQGQTPAALLRALDSAADLDELARTRARVGAVLEGLVRLGVEPEQATRVITALNDRASQRALGWAARAATEEIAVEANREVQLPPFCWLALGSEGRQEQTFATDQDNALIHAAAPGDPFAHRWLELFTRRATDSLERLGFPRCPGNVMASVPHWRRSLDGWREQVRHWIAVADEQAMLEAAIFFDFRPLHGDATLARALRATVRQEIPRNDIVLAHLTRAALRNRPPLGLIRTFVVERSGEHRDTLDLKERGMAPLVDSARVLALGNGIVATNTFDRLTAAAEARAISHELAEDAREAYAFLMLVRIQHHFALQARGRAPDNHLNPQELSSLQRHTLKLAFQVVQAVQGALTERFGGYLPA